MSLEHYGVISYGIKKVRYTDGISFIPSGSELFIIFLLFFHMTDNYASVFSWGSSISTGLSSRIFINSSPVIVSCS